MSFHAAHEFARWLSQKTGHKYRLPTEAEWIHACTSGAAGPAAGGALASRAWFADNAADQTHAVGTLPPDAHGLHDMLGNVSEWVVAQADSVVMGGNFLSDPANVTCTSKRRQTDAWSMRDPQLPKSRWWLTDAPFVGFRLVRES